MRKQDVADALLLSVRHVDRLIEADKLKDMKLNANRAGRNS